jgi:hypothetical protein
MPSPTMTLTDPVAQERRLLDRLLGLYDEERQLYLEVLTLSRRQGEAIRGGAPVGEVRRLLSRKKSCLETIGHLELTEKQNKSQWRQGRANWSPGGRARLHDALQDVGQLIESILECEEANDRALMELAR